MILMLKVKEMFLKCFMIKRLKYFHDSLNIAVILAPGCEFFFTKCAQFPLTLRNEFRQR